MVKTGYDELSQLGTKSLLPTSPEDAILEMVKSKCGKNLIQAYPIEIFEDKDSLGENKKSVTFKMVFQDREKTLEDKDVNPIIDEIIDIAKKNFNAKLRV